MTERAGNGDGAPLLRVEGLEKRFPVSRGPWLGSRESVRAVDGVDFHVGRAETLALVGESGSGKTTTGRCVLRLVEPTSGRILFDGVDLLSLGGRSLRAARRRIQTIFQDPYGSLDPRMSIRSIVAEPLAVHRLGTRRERDDRVAALLGIVGLDPAVMHRHPHEFSGGQRQRIGLARALAVDPELIVCDEPVSALDLSVQAQVVNLLVQLQQERALAYLFIAHDLAVVRHIAHRVAVMYLGRIVETAPAERIFAAPKHPYTQALLASTPVPDPDRRAPRPPARGTAPSPTSIPSGCRFRGRCPVAVAQCADTDPPLRDTGEGHEVACLLAK